jgi:hypothetical protein
MMAVRVGKTAMEKVESALTFWGLGMNEHLRGRQHGSRD